MRPLFLQALAELRPMIKTCWEVLLRAEPSTSALGNPDTLVYMMDDTLDQFFAAFLAPAPKRWLARRPYFCGSLEETCPCRRNPLLRYFVSGEQALLAIAGKAVLGEAHPEQLLAEAQLTFHYLAQQELQNFCDLCQCDCPRAGLEIGRPARSIQQSQRAYLPRRHTSA